MKTLFSLAWYKPGKPVARAFKTKAGFDLFEDYRKRIHPFSECEVAGSGVKERSGTAVWICDRERGKQLSSEDLAKRLDELRSSGIQRLHLGIGGPDGFSSEEIASLKPDFTWSFGPMTLPHELAAVVTAEQIYRAWTILKNHPYHSGH